MSDELNLNPVQQKRKRRGSGEGSIFKPAGSKNLYIGYYAGGRQVTESARTSVRAVAVARLQARIAAVKAGAREPQRADRLLLSELFDDVLLDYEVNNYASRGDAEARIRLHLKPFFGEGFRACAVRSTHAQQYIIKRREKGAEDSTIANELSLLRRAFNLALENEKLSHVPYIALPSGYDKPRQGFIEVLQYRALLSNLPAHVRPVVALAFYTGARRGELLSLRWDQVDLRMGFIKLSAEDTKTRTARTIPVASEPLALLLEQRKVVDAKCPAFPFVFFREPRPNEKKGGPALLPLGDFDNHWKRACCASGLGEMVEVGKRKVGDKKEPILRYRGLVCHDLRRSAVRSMVRAGVPESVAMKVSGHTTRAIFSRYDICSEADLSAAARSVGDHLRRIEETANQGKAERLLNLENFGRRPEELPASEPKAN
jgi:integrase